MIDVQFLGTPSGSRFVAYYPGTPGKAPLLVIPPFTEEMNKSRRQIHLLGQRLSALGRGLLLPDLLGTGDSPGEFQDGSLSRWAEDLNYMFSWLQQRYEQKPAVLAIRAGTLLAASLPCQHLALWAPILTGEQWLNSFLRLRVMASRLAGGNETAKELIQEAHAQGAVEVAGYALSSDFVSQLLAAKSLTLAEVENLLVLDAGAPAETPPPGLKALLEKPRTRRWARLEGPAFWQSVETETHAGLIDSTCAWLSESLDASPTS